MPFEHHRQPVAPHHVFVRRLFNHLGVSIAILGFTLTIGIVGYTRVGHLSWPDAVVESAMLMGGMGPVYGQELPNTAAKLFSAAYALFCGLVLIALFGIILAPVLHRILHRLHVTEK